MILHDYLLSSASYRVRIALALKGVAYERRNHALKDDAQRLPAYLATNPAGLVPTLEVPGGPTIAQSLAIIDWLDATYPEPRLIPADPVARARAWEMALTIAADIHPIDNLRVLRYLKGPLGHDQATVDEWYRHWVTEGLATLEALAPDAPYLGGAAPGLADICLVPQIYNARRFKTDLTRFPRIVAIADRAAGLPAFVEAAPPPLR